MSLALAAFAIVATYAAGDAFARALGVDRELRRGLAFLLGPAVIAFAMFALNLMGIATTTSVCRALGGVAIAAWIASMQLKRTDTDVPIPTTSALERIIGLAVPTICVGLGIAFVWLLPPANDAFSNWGLKALALARDGTVRTTDLSEQGRFLFHPNYPLLVPLAQAFVHACVGTPTEGAARGVFVLAQLGAGLVVFAALRQRVVVRIAALAAAMLVVTPHFWRSAQDLRFPGSIAAGYADPMFTALVAGVVGTALVWAWRPTAKNAAALGACVGFALFTKNEGQPLTLALLGAAVLALVGARLRGETVPKPRSLLVAAGVAAAIATPWFAFRTTLPARDENYQQQVTTERIEQHAWRASVIAAAAVNEALAVDRHGLTWVALALALVLRLRRIARAAVAFVLALLGAMTAAYALVFVVTPLPIVDSLATSIPRTFFHMAPVAIVAVALLCGPREVDA
ncbi:MAG: hypothetical protein IPH13_14770 [Planctomycetes bacterium]|nr:hypothetical protein [Planctomycetota bacterium]